MIVVISNKLKSLVEKSDLNELGCKYTVGCFSVDTYIRNLQSYSIDYLIVDVTAIQNHNEPSSWQKLRDFFNPDKTIILMGEEKFYSSAQFLTMLTKMGFYNFTSSADQIVGLMEHPNTSSDLDKYFQTTKEGNYQNHLEGHKAMMVEYRENEGQREVVPKKKENVLNFQLSVGFIALPILTFICVLVIYALQVVVSNYIPLEGDSVGEYLYGELAHTGFTPLILIGFLLCSLILAIYYSSLNAKIKRKQMSRVKFMLIPIGVYCAFIFGEYYFIGLFEKIYQWVMIFPISDKPYLYQDLYDLSRWVAILAIILYYFGVMVNNSKVVKFEMDLSQNLTILEKLWTISLLFILLVPLSYQLSLALPQSNSIYQFFDTYYSQSLMMIIVIVELFLTILVLLQPKFMREKEYTILKEEDL